jgi:hypothetical protein
MAAPWTAVDVVTVALGCASLILTALAVFLGVLAIWGYRDIKAASIRAAETEARRVAEDVSAREMRAFLDKQGAGADISAAYQDRPPWQQPG